MSSHQITPDETHVIKAMAWDALYASLSVSAKIEKDAMALSVKAIMDTTLGRVGNTVSKSSTWELGMAKKFKNDLYYKCVACGTATKKDEWLSVKGMPEEFSKCPHCGGLFDLSVGNEIEPIDEPVQYPDTPEPPKPKKPAAKK